MIDQMIKNKNGRPPKRVDNIRDAIRARVQFRKVIDTLYKKALGGQPKINGNGVEIFSEPDLDAAKLLLEYAYGKPTQFAVLDEDLSTQLAAISSELRELVLPKGNVVITEDGDLSEQALTQHQRIVRAVQENRNN